VSVRRLAALVAVVLLMTACNADELISLRLPECGETGARTTFLMAQSVPDAAFVPCIDAEALPRDMYTSSMRIDSSATRLTQLGDWPNDSEQPLRLDVLFTPACDTDGAVAVPTDEPGMQRLERVARVANGYSGERYYVFDGGCVTYRFDAQRDDWLGFVHEASQAWTFMPRTEVERLRDLALDACDEAYARLAIRLCDR
jgi:hypothetical protein